MTPIRSYRDLIVWQKAMTLAALWYTKTRSFPRTEAFGLTTQIRRAAGSVPANVAEGNGREMEVNDANQILEMTEEVGKLLHSLIRALQGKEAV